jgi:DNA-binding CsgD family transcriptional regulator
LHGNLWLSRKILSRCILAKDETEAATIQMLQYLTLREKEILKYVASGLRNKEIADKLNISLHTVKTHLYNVYKKIEVPSRLQATLWAAAYLDE